MAGLKHFRLNVMLEAETIERLNRIKDARNETDKTDFRWKSWRQFAEIIAGMKLADWSLEECAYLDRKAAEAAAGAAELVKEIV